VALWSTRLTAGLPTSLRRTVPGPDLPESISTLSVRDDRPTAVAAVSCNDHWRILKRAGQGGTSYTVALPLDTVDGATAELLWLTGIVLLIAV
jgi:two-component system OmpR family sensor kinase